MVNALLGRFRSSRDPNPRIETYIYISGLITGMHDLTQQLDDIALSGKGRGSGRGEARATQGTENERLRGIYATDSWAETNDVVEEWIFGLFEKALSGNAELDKSWPDEDRISFGYEHLHRARTALRSWLASKEPPPVYYDEPATPTAPTDPPAPTQSSTPL
jgi:hypothetical protein